MGFSRKRMPMDHPCPCEEIALLPQRHGRKALPTARPVWT
ncbi:hypothetical protein SSAG_00956 [Streptomyces sp. Mg1]|nr:hypothetical protein SSAG_00956 [Streptomyces sp. Mg1]